MAAQGCDIYLDPWVKDDKEGHALLLNRIPDIPESTHHGVTCQRWRVRFAEDQDATTKWLDYGDAIDWVPPAWNISVYQTQILEYTFSEGNVTKAVSIGEIALGHSAPDIGHKPVIPKAGRIRHIGVGLRTRTVVDTPPPLLLGLRLAGIVQDSITIPDGNLSNKWIRFWATELTPYVFPTGTTLHASLYCPCTGAQELPLDHVFIDLHIQWGNFT